MSIIRHVVAAFALLAAAAASAAPLQQINALAAGETFTCALREDASVDCWGANDFGQLGDGSTVDHALPGKVAGLSGITAVATGHFHACALDDAGVVRCWGHGGAGQLGQNSAASSSLPLIVPLPTTAVAVTAGGTHSCAQLATGELRCWGMMQTSGCAVACLTADRAAPGSNGYGSLQGETTVNGSSFSPRAVVLPAGFVAARLTSGENHTCALSPDGRVACWGDNQFDQLGAGTPPDEVTALEVVFAKNPGIAAVSAGGTFSCAVLNSGAVRCWGFNGGGALGDGSENSSAAPVAVALPSGVAVVQVASGQGHSCALTATGSVYCWGANGYGQNANTQSARNLLPQVVPALAGRDLTALSAGYVHTCALFADRTAACWGAAHFGQLGDGRANSRGVARPALVAGPSQVAEIAVGSGHSCAVDGAGALWCWGQNYLGQLGLGNDMPHAAPVQVPGLAGLNAVAVGRTHTCAGTSTTLWCWGRGSENQLGGASTALSVDQPLLVPNFPPQGRQLRQLSASEDLTCARLDDGSVWCWGSSLFGNGGSQDTLAQPTAVAGLPLVRSDTVNISVGPSLSCAALSDGSARCWGLQNETISTVVAPVAGLPGVNRVSAGDGYACAGHAGGVNCWGKNWDGQLGDGSFVSSAAPVSTILPAGSTAVAVAAASWHSCAALSNGSAWCWGMNSSGQLGNGAPSMPGLTTPAQVSGLAAVDRIVAGLDYTCARNAGSLFCWGGDFFGQAGTGTAFRTTPTSVLDGDRLFASDFE